MLAFHEGPPSPWPIKEKLSVRNSPCSCEPRMSTELRDSL